MSEEKKAPPQVADAVDAIARVLEPDAWAEYDAGNGVCSMGAASRALGSLEQAKALLKRWPAIGDIVVPGRGTTAAIQGILRGTPAPGHRDGETYDADLDFARLNKQSSDVWAVMRDGRWRSLAAISDLTGHPQASVSARLRDFRKGKFGRHTVERVREDGGLWLYRLQPREGVKVQAE